MAAENEKIESKANAVAPASQGLKAFELNTQKEKVTKKKSIDILGRPAKGQINGKKYKLLHYRIISNAILKRGEMLNDQLLAVRREVIRNANQVADAEAKLESKYSNTKIGAGNNNIIAIRMKELMRNATSVSTINPILDKNNLDLTNFRNECNGRTGQLEAQKPKPLNIIELLKDELVTIGAKYKTYRRKETENESNFKKEMTPEEKIAAAKKAIGRAPFKKAFRGVTKIAIKDDQSKLNEIKREVAIEQPVESSKIITIDELRRRKLLGEAGEGIDQINRLEKSLGENEVINDGLKTRKSKFLKIIKDLGRVETTDKDVEIDVPDKTEFQSAIDELLNIKDPMTKEEHDAKERELNAFYSDPFVISQLERQRRERELDYYNNPEVSLKISEAERIADKQLSSKIRDNFKQFDDDTLVKNVLESKVEKGEDGKMVIVKKDADILAHNLFIRNLAAQAVDEVIANYKKDRVKDIKAKKDAETKKDIKQKEQVEDYKVQGRKAAHELFLKGLVTDAVKEVTENYKKEVEKGKVSKQPEQASPLSEKDKIIAAARKDVEDNKEELKSIFMQKQNALNVISNAKNLISTRKMQAAADRNAKNLAAKKAYDTMKESAKQEAKRIHINNIKIDADEMARIILNKSKTAAQPKQEAVVEQPKVAKVENLQQVAVEQPKVAKAENVQQVVAEQPKVAKVENVQQANPNYVITNSTNRYNKEIASANKIKLPETRFSRLLNVVRKKNDNVEKKDMLVSLRDQLTNIDLGENEHEESIRLAA